MEINGSGPLLVLKNGMQRLELPQVAEKSAKSGKASVESDQLVISDRGREIAHLNELIQSTPDVREDRVEQVRQQLDSGTYSVKAEKIAEKIIVGNLLDEVC
jgi:negative regulator of flagellin synthesis FlgM